METYTVRSEPFPELGDGDLGLYRDVSEALRNFEIVAIYNFKEMTAEERAEWVPKLIKHLKKGYQKLFMTSDGKINCGPLCPGVRSCYMCKWMVEEHSSSEPDPAGTSA